MKLERITRGLRLASRTCLFAVVLVSLLAGGAVQKAQAGKPASPSYQPYAAVTNPSLIWNSFLGSRSYDIANDIARDGSGNLYAVGSSTGAWTCAEAPCTIQGYHGDSDAFAAKLDPAGHLIWNTFLGSGGGSDSGLGVAVDANGNASIIGMNGYTGMWVSRLDASGNLIWTTALGPSQGHAGAIAMDTAGNAYATGYFVTATNATVAFASKLDSSGNILWKTLLPRMASGYGSGIVADRNGNTYITGDTNKTWGTPRRPYQGDSDAFVVKLDASGHRIWNTFLGGSGTDESYGIARDAKGNIFVTGNTQYISWGQPILPLIDTDAYVAKLDPWGNLVWNTFVGSFNGGDFGNGVAVDSSGNVYAAGRSYYNWGYPAQPLGTHWGIFAARFSSSGELLWNTFLGGDGNDEGGRLAVDNRGHMFVAASGVGGWGKQVRRYGGGSDGFVAKVSTPWATVFRSTGSQDGWVLESSETSGLGGSINATATTVRLGDNPTKRQYRSILSFPTGTLPNTATILIAALTLRGQSVTPAGTDPIKMFQGMQIEVRKGCFNANCALQAGDFQAAASAAAFGPFDPTPDGTLYTIFLPSAMYPYINKLDTGGGRTQLRLRFNLDDNNDLIANYLSFYSGNVTAASYRPALTILYYGP